MLANSERKVHPSAVSAVDLLKEVQALPPGEREKFVFALLECQEIAPSAPARKRQRVKWPDVQARARRIFGKRVFPNLVLLERSEKNW
jgi:hypothetical protein